MVNYSNRFSTSRRSSSSSSSSNSSELDSAFKGGSSNQSQRQRQTHKEKQVLQQQEQEITQILKECGQDETSYIKRVVATHPLPPVNSEFQEGWCYITKDRYSGKSILYVHNAATSRGHVKDDMSLNEKMAIACESSFNNWQRYREQYDSINGEGQYEMVYTCKNTQESDDDDDDDDESEVTD